MSVVTNLAPNPSIETGTTGWILWTGAGTLDRLSIPAEAPVGDCFIRARAAASQSNFGLQLAAIPLAAGPVGVGVMLRSNMVGAYARIRFDFRNASGSTIGGFIYGAQQALAVTPFTRVVAVATAPAGTTQVVLVLQVTAANGVVTTVPASTTLDADALILAQQATVPAYGDGDLPGWAWAGTPHASTSTGPSKPYSPDAELTGQSGFHAWLDMVPEFGAESTSRTVVQLPQQTHPVPYVVGRNAGPRTGTLRVHFVRELADGTPGERSAAFEEHLRGGSQPRTLTWAAEVGGLETFQFIPTGRIVRRLEHASISRKRLAVWTVECEYTEATA